MNQLLKYQKVIDRLPTPARTAILLVVLGIVSTIWHYGLWQTLHHSIIVTSKKIAIMKQSIPELTTQVQSIENDIKRKREQKNTEQNATSKLLSPHQTNNTLYDLLNTNGNLVLVQLKNTPPKMVFLSQSNIKIFEHGVIIKFQGDYFSVINYLQAIEKLKWKIFWDRLEYRVIQHPIAEITLHIHTISNYEDWINV